MQAKVDPAKLMSDLFAAIDFLMHHEEGTGKVGITGFCYGGGVANAAAVAFPDLACAVPFYGRQPQGMSLCNTKDVVLWRIEALVSC